MYLHTQMGSTILLALGLAIAVLLIGVYASLLPQFVLIVVLGFAIALALFSRLTVRVDHEALTLHFGIGLVHRRFPLAGVADVQVVRSRWWHGWGIHWFGNGWLYNVSGLDAVQLSYGDGRAVRVGTDEPQQLLGAIREALQR